MKEREYWIDYLRSFIILTVVIHHATLAYTTFAHFNKEAYILSTHPMVDAQRWIGFDRLVYFNDIHNLGTIFFTEPCFAGNNKISDCHSNLNIFKLFHQSLSS